jgi:hypothetical protein
MKPRIVPSVPLLVLVAVLALALGSVGTATAAGLTTSQVKKIATKVVKKKAKTLTVANAANATNATNLAGKPASAYLDESRVFTTTITSAVGDVVVNLPLTTGTYYVSYHAYLYGGSGYSGCYLRKAAGATTLGYLGDDVGTSPSPAYSGSAVVDLAAGQSVELFCFSATSFTTLSAPAPDPIQVVATPLDGVTTTAIPPSRPSGAVGRP